MSYFDREVSDDYDEPGLQDIKSNLENMSMDLDFGIAKVLRVHFNHLQ